MVIPVYLADNVPAVTRLVSMAKEAGVTAITFCNSEAALAAARAAGLDPIISVGENVGYGRAANIATEGRDFSWLILCNDDLEIEPGDFSTFIGILRSTAPTEPWVIGLIGWDEPDRPSVPGLKSVFANLSLLSATKDRLVPPRRSAKPLTSPTLTEPPCGAVVPFLCAAISVASWTDLGGFDDRYSLYYEDMDYLRRACRLPGHRLGIVRVRADHRRSASARATLDRTLPVLVRSAYEYLTGKERRHSLPIRLMLTLALLIRLPLIPLAASPIRTHLEGAVRAVVALVSLRPPTMPPWNASRTGR